MAKDVALAELQSWLEDADCFATIPFKGPEVGKVFTLQFGGTGTLAALQAQKAFDLLRDFDIGVWRAFDIQTPAKRTVRLFVGEDKSTKQQRSSGSLADCERWSRNYTRIRRRLGINDYVKSITDGFPLRESRSSLPKHSRPFFGTTQGYRR